MANVVAANTATAAAERLYPPSWVDRLECWIERLPGPVWLFYAVWAGALLAAEFLPKWADGIYPAGFRVYHVVSAVSGVYFLAVLHWLDHAAANALAAFRPAMTSDDATYAAWHYRLTTLPAAWPILGSLAGMIIGAVILVLTPQARFRELALWTSPGAMVVDIGLWFFCWGAVGTLSAHALHQLRLISHILTTQARIDLFALQPLYAFSRLTGATAACVVLTIYAWAAAVPQAFSESGAPLVTAVALFLLVLAAGTFVWPLWGVHRLLLAEKGRWQAGVAQRVKVAIVELERRVDAGDLAEVESLKTALDGLVVSQAALDKISTWPWPTGTLRSVTTAILLPILLWLIFRLLERLLPS